MKLAALLLVCLLPGCALPDRWNAGYAHEPAAGTLAARDIYSVGVAADDGTDPGIIFKLPAGLDESILSALFLGRFCKSPWVKDAEHRAFLVQDAEGAMKKLMAFQKQAESGASMKSRGFGF